MAKYTIIYAKFFHVKSPHSATLYSRVETDNLEETLKDPKYGGNIWFVLEGWPELVDYTSRKTNHEN